MKNKDLIEKKDDFKFPPLDELKADLIKYHGDNKETWDLIEGFIEIYKIYKYPINLSTSKVKIKWV